MGMGMVGGWLLLEGWEEAGLGSFELLAWWCWRGIGGIGSAFPRYCACLSAMS